LTEEKIKNLMQENAFLRAALLIQRAFLKEGESPPDQQSDKDK
jgi:hypothetical protein